MEFTTDLGNEACATGDEKEELTRVKEGGWGGVGGGGVCRLLARWASRRLVDGLVLKKIVVFHMLPYEFFI